MLNGFAGSRPGQWWAVLNVVVNSGYGFRTKSAMRKMFVCVCVCVCSLWDQLGFMLFSSVSTRPSMPPQTERFSVKQTATTQCSI